MMRSFTILMATLVIASLGTGSTRALYRRINNYLVEKVKSDDVGANLEAASKWLEEQENIKQSFLTRTPIEDLKKFTALQQVVEDTTCDHMAYDIMSANEKAVGSQVLLGSRQTLRRVDKVMLEIFENHAKRCWDVYPVTYRTMKLELDAVLFERAKKLAQTVIEADKMSLFVGKAFKCKFDRNSETVSEASCSPLHHLILLFSEANCDRW